MNIGIGAKPAARRRIVATGRRFVEATELASGARGCSLTEQLGRYSRA
jgi:hypothetical protein